MATFAIIETGGKQYRVSQGSKIKIEKLPGEPGSEVIFENVLLTANGDAVTVGTPHVPGVRVVGKVLSQGRAKKKIVFKYHAKARYRKKKGHRQQFTEVEIAQV
ncbi:MAG: 50S ribosomal protein L21 [Patescibacteria group bacterium]